MLTHSPPNISRSNPVVLDAQRQGFDPYVPASDSVKEEGFAKPETQVLPSAPAKLRSCFEGITNVYGVVTRMFGFNEKYSLGLCACKTLITLLPTYSLCSDFLWGCSYRILSRTDPDDEPSKSTRLDYSRCAPSNMCSLSCGIISVRL